MPAVSIHDGRKTDQASMHEKIFCFVAAGRDSGKTFVMEQIIAELKRRGRRICAVKHGRHFEGIDIRDKDTDKFSAMGADRVIAFSDSGMFLYEKMPPTDTRLADLAAAEADLVLIEGYKNGPFQKIEVFNHRIHAKPLLQTAPDIRISAIISDRKIEGNVPWFSFADIPSICNYIEKTAGLP